MSYLRLEDNRNMLPILVFTLALSIISKVILVWINATNAWIYFFWSLIAFIARLVALCTKAVQLPFDQQDQVEQSVQRDQLGNVDIGVDETDRPGNPTDTGVTEEEQSYLQTIATLLILL